MVEYKITNVYECNYVNDFSRRTLYDVTSDTFVSIENILPDAVYIVWITPRNNQGKGEEAMIEVRGYGFTELLSGKLDCDMGRVV